MALSRRDFVRRLGAGGAAVASATGIIGYGAYAGSYCSQLYYYDYYRWLYACQ